MAAWYRLSDRTHKHVIIIYSSNSAKQALGLLSYIGIFSDQV